jgi:hypothetical protein
MLSNLPEDLKIKIASLQDAILNTHPQLPIILRDIHKALKDDPANVTLLSEEEIGTIVSGLKKQTATEIASSTLKKSTKALSKVTADDL